MITTITKRTQQCVLGVAEQLGPDGEVETIRWHYTAQTGVQGNIPPELRQQLERQCRKGKP